MRFQLSFLRPLSLLGLAGATAMLATPALAQNLSGPDQIHVLDQVVVNPVSMNTNSFFPQVNLAAKPKSVRPSNPHSNEPPANDPVNDLVAGALGKVTGTAVPGAKFPGAGFSGSVPPDPDMAAGPAHVIQVVNGSVSFYTKDGTKVFQQADSNNAFWSGLGATSFIFDPKAFYDQLAGRFVIVELELDEPNEVSNLLIAISDDNNPLGTWSKYRLDSKLTQDSTDYWLDYPGWGYNKDGYVVTGNMFEMNGGGSAGGMGLVWGKANMLLGQPVTVTRFTGISFTAQMAKTFDANSNFVYGVARPSPFGTNSSLKVYAFGDLATATPTGVSTTVTVPSYSSFNLNATSLGGRQLDSIGDRVMSAYSINGRVLACHTTKIPNENRCQVSWYEFNVGQWPTAGTPTLFQAGNINLPNNQFAYMGSIAKNTLGDISVVYTRSSTDISADTVVSVRKQADAAGALGAPTLLAASAAASAFSPSRWGDYSDCELDPNGFSFWGTAEVTVANGFWGTTINTWNVSVGGGGGGGNGGTDVESFETWLGTYISGGKTDFMNSDNKSYVVRSEVDANLNQASGIRMTFRATAPGTGVQSADFKIEGYAQFGTSVTGTVFCYNHTTGAWDFIKTFGLSSTGDTENTVSIPNVANYIDSRGVMHVRLRAHEPYRRNTGASRQHILRVDLAKAFFTLKP
jgi:hypothetical protein